MEPKNKCRCGEIKLESSKRCKKCFNSRSNKSVKPSRWGRWNEKSKCVVCKRILKPKNKTEICGICRHRTLGVLVKDGDIDLDWIRNKRRKTDEE